MLILDTNGNYKANGKEGTARIKVELKSNTEHKDDTIVEVKKCRMDEIKLDDDTINKEWDDNTKDSVSCRISAYIYAEKGAKYSYITDKEVEWSPSDQRLCKITPIKHGIMDGEINVGREVASVEIAQPGLYMVFVNAKNNPGAHDSCKIRVEGIKQTKEIPTLGCGDNINLRDYFKFMDKNDNIEKAKFILVNNPSDILYLSENGHLEWPKDKYLALDIYCDIKLQIEGHSKRFRVHVQS